MENLFFFLLDDLWSPYFSQGFIGDAVLVLVEFGG